MRQFIPHIVCGDIKLHPPTCGMPYFIGLSDEEVMQGDDFNLRNGVMAFDADGNPVPYTIDPNQFEPCLVGEQVFTYSIGEDYSRDRIITVIQADAPTITGADTGLEEDVGVAFDPLEGVTAEDGNGNQIAVTVTLL